MKKRILSIVLSIVMLVGLLPTTAWAADTHSHCVCGAEHKSIGDHTTETSKNFEAWDNATSLPQSGSYYLNTDVVLTATANITGELNLCLNGHSITNATTAISVNSGATLNICDCGTVNVYSGTVSSSTSYGINNSGTVNVYSGTVSSSTSYGIYNKGTVNVYGGTVSSSNTTGIYNANTSSSTTTVNIYGGEVSGAGYGINNGSGTVNVYGGTVTGANDGIANGANVNNVVNVSGGTVTGNGRGVYGYGITNLGNGTLKLSGNPTITGSKADIYLENNTSTSTITITAALTYAVENAISVKMDSAGTFTTGWTTMMGENADYDSYFTSASSVYTVQPDSSGELKLAAPITYTVTYDGNGATSGTVPTDGTSYASGSTVTVLGNTGNLAKTGYAFVGWNTWSSGYGTDYAPGATFNINSNTTLYAQWEEYEITTQPTESTPAVGTNADGDIASYQWYKGTMSEVTDTADGVSAYTEDTLTSSYSGGWWTCHEAGGYSTPGYFTIVLNAGDSILAQTSSTINEGQLGIWAAYEKQDWDWTTPDDHFLVTAPADGNYDLHVSDVTYGGGTQPTVKAQVFHIGSTPADGATSKTLEADEDGWYACKITYKDGTVLCSGPVEYEAPSIPVSGVTLNESSLTLDVGDTAELTATISPNNATDKTVSWTSSVPTVAKVENGLVTALNPGSTTITATANDGSGKSATCSVTVNKIAITGPIAITTTKEPTVGQEFSLDYIVIPDGNYRRMGRVFSPQLSIEAGKDYTLSVELKPNDGYYFADGVAATVNGKAATVVRSGDNISIKYTYSFASPAANSVDILLSGSSAGIAPVVLPGINEADVTMDFTAKVLDQYGQEMSGQTVEWSITGTNTTGISVNDGTVTVTKDAAEDNYTLTATCGDKSDSITVQVEKAASVATSIKIFKGENEVTADTIYIPEQYRNTVNYTAVVYDQYGEVMSADDAEITKTHENTTATGFGSAEVNNRSWNVYVDASTGKTGSFDLVLTSGNASASVHITFAYLETQTITCANVTGTYGQTEELKLNPSGKQTADAYRFAIKSGASTDVVEVASDGKLTIKNAGETTIVVTAPSDATHASASVEVKVTIDKADMSAEVTAEGYNAVFDNQPHTITVTIPVGASVKYGTAIGTYNLDSAPTYTNAETYTVYYKVEKTNYNEVTGSANVVITAKDIANAEIILGEALTFNGNEQTQTIASATVDGLAITYNVSGNVNTNAGNYTLTITGNGNFEGTAQKTYAIARKSIEGANVGSFNAMTYTGSAQTPVASVTIDGLTATGTWSNVTNVADTTTFTADGNFTGTIANRNAGMSKATPVVTAPVAADGLVYNGTAQKLATAGSTTAGILKYSIDNANWIDTIPEETNAANYTVYYKVIGDENYNDVVAQSISVSIAKADSTATPPTANTLTYNTSAQTLVTAGIANGGQMQYSLDGTTWSADIPAGTNANTYTVYYKVVGDANHDDNAGGSVSVTIGKADKTAPEVAGVDETIKSKADGRITGVDDTMEYKKQGDANYIAITADTVENLAAGTYLVRYKETENYFASSDKQIVIADGVMLTIAFNSNEGTSVDSVTCEWNQTITAPTEPTKDGFEFISWYLDDTLTTKWTNEYQFTADTTLYAKWVQGAVSDHEDHVDEVEADGLNDVAKAEETDITLVVQVEPAADGDVEQSAIKEMTDAPNNFGFYDITLEKSTGGNVTNASSVIEIKLPYDFTRKTNIKVYRHHSGVAVELAQLEARATASYVDGKCYVDKSNNCIYIYSSKFSTYAVAYDAVRSSSGGGTTRYTVKFDTDGGSSVSSATVAKNAKVTEPKAPEKDGYTFGGWYTDKELTEKYDFESKVTKNFTLFAKWDKHDDEQSGTDTHNCPSLAFDDLDITKWYHLDTDYVIENGIFKGTTETTFEPDSAQTRAMMVTVLYRAEGEPAVNRSIPFADVDMGAYYANAVIWGQQNGIIKGYSETEFGPDDKITREQIAAIMHRYAQYKGIDVSVGENTNILS